MSEEKSHEKIEFEPSLEQPPDEEQGLLTSNRELRIRKTRKCCVATYKVAKTNALLISTVVAVVLGIALGLAVHSADPPEVVRQLVAFPGELFLRSLKMLILPLIVFSLIAGLGSLDLKVAGALGLRTILYYGTTTILAVALGIILVVSIKPGSSHVTDHDSCTNKSSIASQQLEVLDSMLDLMRNMVPDNLFSATFEQTDTQYTYYTDWKDCARSAGYNITAINMTCYDIEQIVSENELDCNNHTTREKHLGTRAGMNILGIIIFAIAFALVLSRLGEDGRNLVHTISVLNNAIMKLIAMIMWYSPIGIASIIAGKILEVDSFIDVVKDLGLYVVCVLLGLFIHTCITLTLIYIILARRNPLKLVKGVLQALLVAFGTSSSSATLPVTMQCLEDNMKFDHRVTQFMLPVGATVNMDGTALYEAVAALFIAQVNEQATRIDHIIIIAITATLASIGAAGIPQAGLVTLVIVLTAVGLPPEDVAFILAVDWFLDRFRTVVNVYGDCVGVGVVSRFSKKQLAQHDTTTNTPNTPTTPNTPNTNDKDHSSDHESPTNRVQFSKL